MTLNRRKTVAQQLLLMITAWIATGGGVTGQQSEAPDAEAAVRCFEATVLDREEKCEPGIMRADAYLRSHEEYSPETIRRILTGLTELALASEVDRPDMYIAVISHIGVIGRSGLGPEVSTVPFLERLFVETENVTLRLMTADHAWQQADRDAAIRFLERAAGDATIRLAEHAVLSLSRMGNEGRAALRGLIARDAFPSSHVKARAEARLKTDGHRLE